MDTTLKNETAIIASSLETGKLKIRHLKRFWNKTLIKKDSSFFSEDLSDEWNLDRTLLSALGLGLEQTLIHLYQINPSFEEFEQWIIETAGHPTEGNIEKFNALFNEEPYRNTSFNSFFNAEQMSFWDKNGYIIIPNAVSKEACAETIEVICQVLNIDQNDSNTWYRPNSAKQGIMVQLFQHPILTQNRDSDKIRRAYEQLWQRKDIWVNADRVGFNPPETSSWKFPGPDLHWDCSLESPNQFGLQGILYLADTAANQGAFTLVPGFQNCLSEWLTSLPKGTNPRTQNLHALGSKSIVANAGDFIIWHQALPHGSSPNTSNKPRFVQYINYCPADFKEDKKWL